MAVIGEPDGTGAGEPLHMRSGLEVRALMRAAEQGRPFVYFRDPEQLQIVPLTPPPTRIALGRNVDADIPITWDEQVSGAHCELERVAGEWFVTDLGSLNGTHVNGRLIGRRTKLRDDDRLRLGATLLVYRDPQATPEKQTKRIGASPFPPRIAPHLREVLVELYRPLRDNGIPATNEEIAARLFKSRDTIRGYMRDLYSLAGLTDTPQSPEKRLTLARLAMQHRVIDEHDFV